MVHGVSSRGFCYSNPVLLPFSGVPLSLIYPHANVDNASYEAVPSKSDPAIVSCLSFHLARKLLNLDLRNKFPRNYHQAKITARHIQSDRFFAFFQILWRRRYAIFEGVCQDCVSILVMKLSVILHNGGVGVGVQNRCI